MSARARAQRKSKLTHKYHLSDHQAVRFLAEYDHLIPFRPGQMARCVQSWMGRESRGAAHALVVRGERTRLLQVFRDRMVTEAQAVSEDGQDGDSGEQSILESVPRELRDAEDEWHGECGRNGEPSFWLVHTDTDERWALVDRIGTGVGVAVRGGRLMVCGLLNGRIRWMGLPELGTGQFAEREGALGVRDNQCVSAGFDGGAADDADEEVEATIVQLSDLVVSD